VDVVLYLEVRQLFGTKWDPAILDVLAERPCRYLVLVRRLRRSVHDRLDDRHVTRALARLQDRGLVRADDVVQGRCVHVVYRLTEGGRQVLGTYRVLLTSYAQARSTAPDPAQRHDATDGRGADPPEGGTDEPPLHPGENR
jgi:DNA-binding HxlR family transcriptional regulator